MVMFKFICVLLITCTSCCTITRGAEQKILVDSNPRGASVVVDGYDCGVTPQYVLLERKHAHRVQIEKEGYQTQVRYLEPQGGNARLSNVMTPFAIGGLGAGVGAIASGNDPWAAMVLIPGGLLIGLAVGSVMGIAGAVVDSKTGADKTLNVQEIHANLYQEL